MPLRQVPPRFILLSLSEWMYQLFGKVASLAGLHIVCASTPSRLNELKVFPNQPGTAVVVFEDSDCYNTLRMVADAPGRFPNTVLILIADDDLNRIFRVVVENHAIATECWESMKREIAKGSLAGSCQPVSASLLTMNEIDKRTIVAEVMENPLLSGSTRGSA